MADTIQVDVCRTPEGGKQTNVATICLWCECRLKELLKEGKFKEKATGDDAKKLHAHLTRFGMQVELGTEKDGKPQESTEVKNGTWGAGTTRALRMFALHPQVASEPAHVLKSDGKAITADLVTKIQEWCRGNVASPKQYWEVKGLQIKEGDLDAIGASAHPEKQTIQHNYIAQIETDLAKIGFAAHKDTLCGLSAQHKPKGVFQAVKANADGEHEDKSLGDIPYLVRKFQRQAQWLWRMKTDGTHIADAKATDASVYAGACNGEVDAATAKALHAWSEQGLHMVIKKFPMEKMTWPPGSGTPIMNVSDDTGKGPPALLRADVLAKWAAAAAEVQSLGGDLRGPYTSSPRGWKGGKKPGKGGKKPGQSGVSAFSWHYLCLATDMCLGLCRGDGVISKAFPHGRQKDGTKFRLWCWATPQPPPPGSAADDLKNPLKPYRNRNIVDKLQGGRPIKFKKTGAPSDPTPLFFATSTVDATGKDVIDVTATEGWYVDVTAIMEKHGFGRINRTDDWTTNDKGWEYWHYQMLPPAPPGVTVRPTFGECLQLIGVHEERLRAVGWSTHEDINHELKPPR